jgi:uncharacterized protein YheU (UPF0270 family)
MTAGNLFFLSKESFEVIEDLAYERLTSLEDQLIESLINSKGLTYGDIELPREERILKFQDDELRGVNQWLAQNEPKEYEKRLAEFTSDVQQSGLI